MYEFLCTEAFDAWLRALRDPLGKARILARLRSAEAGNFGDCASVGGAVLEMRVHVGPGYRVYLTQRGRSVYLLLCGGEKRSQERDIRQALRMVRNLEDRE
jgi:putative addiction module killer protein